MINAQEFYDKYQQKKEQVRILHEEMAQMEEEFVAQNKLELEYPVVVEGKQKFLRLYKPEGRFVYNVKYEVGIRATAKNPADV